MTRLMAFVDGENLTARFSAMVGAGRQPRVRADDEIRWPVVKHGDSFVWSPATVFGIAADHLELVRAHYYTTFVGGSDVLDEFSEWIGQQFAFRFADGGGQRVVKSAVPLIPRVFHKTARKTRTKSVDINLCVEALEYVHRDAVDAIYLVTGDVDYLPLIEAVMRAGKRVFLAALSSGLSPRLKYGVDRFVPLDDTYFRR